MALTVGVRDRLVKQTRDAISRGGTLHQRICLDGGTIRGGSYSGLLNVDRRDAAAFIFFETAAQFEHFCSEAFKIEVRKKFGVTPSKAEFIMGTADRGLGRAMGWAVPSLLKQRANNLFGKTGFFGRFDTLIAQPTYDRLGYAHKVRNRIAHNGSQAASKYNGILGLLGVPVASRRGMSPGRLLMDYPQNALANDRWFARFLAAYSDVVDEFEIRVAV